MKKSTGYTAKFSSGWAKAFSRKPRAARKPRQTVAAEFATSYPAFLGFVAMVAGWGS